MVVVFLFCESLPCSVSLVK